MPNEFDYYKLKSIPSPLLKWYDKNARILPWREAPTPYRVWVSEIMLQQTRVSAVMPYFERFMNELPDVYSLAACPETQLLKLWEGLGYYNRVRNLQKAAKILVEQYHGQLPKDYHALLSLPGIGEYTAGAISSIAYRMPYPAVDGNVCRVIMRILDCHKDIGDAHIKKEISKGLQSLKVKRIGDFNQALMELGALICVPNGCAKCLFCPILHLCGAYEAKTVEQLPVKSAKVSKKIEERTVLLLIYQERIALTKRNEKGLLANMWEFPNVAGRLNLKEIEDYLQKREIKIETLGGVKKAKHVFTHLIWQMNGIGVQVQKPNDIYEWVTLEEINRYYPIPSAYRVFHDWIAPLQREFSRE